MHSIVGVAGAFNSVVHRDRHYKRMESQLMESQLTSPHTFYHTH